MRPYRTLANAVGLILLVAAVLPSAASAQGDRGRGGGRGGASVPLLPPIDRQVVRDQDDMTWDDYRPIPGVKWADSTRASERTIRIAMVLADFDDHPFVMTLPRHSDPFGNPQIDPVPRERIPQYEWTDIHNRLHFYVVDVHHAANGLLSYTLAVRSLDGAGPQQRGVALTPPSAAPAPDGRAEFVLGNTGARAPVAAGAHSGDVSRFLDFDVYRLSASVEGQGWSAQLQNVLAAVPFGATQAVPVFVRHAGNAADSATVTLRAASESDPTKSIAATYRVTR